MMRELFPILRNKNYLASHSLGAVPIQTKDNLNDYYEQWAEQGILAWEGPWWKSLLDFSASIESILEAPAGTVVPMENVTRGFAAIASCFDFSGKRNKIILSDLEFTTSYPFWNSIKELGARITIVKSEDRVSVPIEAFEKNIDEQTLLIASSHVYFRSGAIQNLKALGELAHRNGAYLLGDGYQAVGTVPINVIDLGVDFYVGGSHKWLCGGPGASYLYVRKDLISSLKPKLRGWFGLQNPFEYAPFTDGGSLQEGIYRFLAGTPSVSALYAAQGGIQIVRDLLHNDRQSIRSVSYQLTQPIVNQALELGLTVRSPHDFQNRSGMVCLDFEESQKVSKELIRRNIIVDWRPDCGIRVSPHFYNCIEDIDHFFSETRQILKR